MRPPIRRPCQQGLTFIELMSVVLMLAIFTPLAVPSYEHCVADGKLTQAESNLTLLSTLMEGYYQDHNAYTANLGALTGCAPGNNSCLTYRITMPYSSLPAPSFQLTATPFAGNGIDGYVFERDRAKNQSEMLPGGATVACRAPPWATARPSTISTAT